MLKLLVTAYCVIFAYAGDWQHKELDPNGKYRLRWKVNEDIIVFQVEVATNGWVGFGISPNGGMAGSDVVIGWVSNGNTTFHDRYAEGKDTPTIDKQQDWELLWSQENDTHTLLRFQREINTCDKEDRIILKSTVRVIYAYSSEDPESADKVTYHGPVTRGTKSLYLFQESSKEHNLGSPQDLYYWDVKSPNVTVPGDVDTSYLCTVIRRPQLDSLHHIIKFEPIIQPGHERFVHHMALYECADGNETKFEPLMKGYHECYTKDQVPNFAFCFTFTVVWAIGGEPMYVPDNAGLPIGKRNAVYFVLEIHYDNPGYERGIVDNSGLRFTYTPKLRKYNAGVLAVGNLWYSCIFVPPKQKEFVVSGHAHPSCLRKEIPSDGIKIFGILLHSHTAGKKIRVRHFRSEKELPPISSEENYDFNYQNTVSLPEEINVLPDDHIIVECTYDTSKRENITIGGLSTRQEMCLSIIFYYPEVPLSLSMSCPSPHNIVKTMGVTQMSNDDKYVISPISGKNESYEDFLNTFHWDDNSIDAMQKVMKYSPQINKCSERGGKDRLVLALARYPNVMNIYKEPNECDKRETQKDEVKPNPETSGPTPEASSFNDP